MCTAQNEIIVHEIVDEFVVEGRMFTAWDVTQEARKRGADEYHNQLKSAVHARWGDDNGRWDDLQSNSYGRATVQIPGVAVSPWVYHPVGTDADDYLQSSMCGARVTLDAKLDDIDKSNGDIDGDGIYIGSTEAADIDADSGEEAKIKADIDADSGEEATDSGEEAKIKGSHFLE
jgi:hypothetical protein|tara:strand:- start:8534 stop:9058 length:525 start_codon:yes stop_codon:yes gene_type:complete